MKIAQAWDWPCSAVRRRLPRVGVLLVSAAALALCVGAHAASQALPLIRTGQHAHVVVGQSCGDYVDRARTFRLGIIRYSLDAPLAFKQPETKQLHVHFTKGDKVIIAGQVDSLVCVSSYDHFPDNGWVPRSSVTLFAEKSTPPDEYWSGIWVNENGNWFTIDAIPSVGLHVVDGFACSAQCNNYGYLTAPPGPPALWPLSKEHNSAFQWTRFFELPERRSDLEDACSPKKPVMCKAGPIPPDVATSCRFYGTLLPGTQRLMISDQQGLCGGLGVNWAGLYYKVAPYPPYPAMTAYFKRLGKTFIAMPEKMLKSQ